MQSNSVYGKCLQNVRDYINVRLHTSKNSALKATADHTFKNYSIIDENLVQTNHYLPTINHNSPIAIGVTILELSKLIMYDAWYNKIQATGCKFDLGMTDTDSFLFKVSDGQKFRSAFKSLMDFSNYEPKHPNFSLENKAKLGYFKDELCGKSVCTEFVGLRSKCYSMRLEKKSNGETEEKKICKGVGRTAIQNRMTFEQFKDCLIKNTTIRHQFFGIRSVNHNVKTILIQKKALNYFDSKRWLFNCGIHSVPYGSYLIKKHVGECPRCLRSFEF